MSYLTHVCEGYKGAKFTFRQLKTNMGPNFVLRWWGNPPIQYVCIEKYFRVLNLGEVLGFLTSRTLGLG